MVHLLEFSRLEICTRTSTPDGGTGNATSADMANSKYFPNLSTGMQVRLVGLSEHAHSGQQCTIIRRLPNPSKSTQNQWYDVRFDDGSIGRFLEKHLVPIDANDENRAA
jgi:hypothetical protein